MFIDPIRPWYVYIKCRPNGSPFYVGKGTKRRAFSYTAKNDRSKEFMEIVRFYGANNLHTHFFFCTTENEAFELEIKIIKTLREENTHILNISKGGWGASGFTHTFSAREKISKAHTGKKMHPNTRKAIDAWLRGRVFTPEYRNAISRALKGKTKSTAHRIKIGAAHKGKKISDKQKAQISARHKGIPLSPEHRAKMRAAALRRYHGR